MRDSPLGIASAPYVRAKRYHYPLSSNDLSLFPVFLVGLVKNLPLLRQCRQTKVKTEEEEVDLPACVFASPLILLGICEFPTTVFLKLQHDRRQVHVDIKRRKPSRECRETDAGAASAPRHGAEMWPHANATALRA